MNGLRTKARCADCPLRALEVGLGRALPQGEQHPEPENVPELQLEQLERSFGPDWKW